MCGKAHELPKPPELVLGMPVMVHAIHSESEHAELNGYEGKIAGPPDADGCYPICMKLTEEVVMLPESMIKTQVYTGMGAMWDGRKEFKSRAVRDEDGNVVLPPLPPPKRMPEKKKGKDANGIFFRNFGMMVKEGLSVERYGYLGPEPIWYPQTGVKHPKNLLWMDTAMQTLSIGLSRTDPYLERFPAADISKIVCWNDGDTASSFGGRRGEGYTTDGGSSLGSTLGSLTLTQGRARPGGGALPPVAELLAEGPRPKVKKRTAGSWSRGPEASPPGSMRRDLTLEVATDGGEAKPAYLHLRCSSTKVRFFLATCFSTLAGRPITEQLAPSDRSAKPVKFEPPPLGVPKDHQKALIGMKACITGGVKVNWSPYVSLRRFTRVTCDAAGYVAALDLPTPCDLDMDLLDFGCLLGQ